MFNKVNSAALYCSHGEEIAKNDMDKLNEWLADMGAGIKVVYDCGPDAATFTFMEA